MKIEELKAELAKIEKAKFIHECKDRWSFEDYEINRRRVEQIAELKKQIEALS